MTEVSCTQAHQASHTGDFWTTTPKGEQGESTERDLKPKQGGHSQFLLDILLLTDVLQLLS